MEVYDQKTIQDLIYLISCCVNEDKPDRERCAGMDLSAIFRAARSHSLTVAAALALEQATTLPGYFYEEKYKAIRRLSLFEIERGRVLRAFEENGIWYAPLKGIMVKELYPRAMMREMLDNDILCDSTKMALIRDIMKGLGFECKRFGKFYHDVYQGASGSEFEIHRMLFDNQRAPELYAGFADIKERLIKDGDNRYGYHMSPEDLYAHMICHLYSHYRHGGIGLRSLLDVYVFNKRYAGTLDASYKNALPQELRLSGFEQRVRRLAERTFRLESLTPEEQSELDFFIESNTNGTKTHIMMHKLDNDDSGKAKLKYLAGRMFPSGDTLKKKHPIVYRYKVLYPFWLLCRPVKGLLYYRKDLLSEMKTLRQFKKKDNKGTLDR